MSAGKVLLFAVVLLALLGGWALARFAVRRFKTAQSMFDTAIDDLPAPVILPETFTCLRCEENPALPGKLWCTVCTAIVDEYPAEPIDHDLEDCISRHPAGKQHKTGGDR